MNITNRGKKWELRNSLWILWSFTLILGCVGFFWIGGRAGKRKWIISGLVYLVVNFGLLYTTQWLKTNNNILYNIAVALICIGWFAAIVQSFMSRKEYLIRREAVLDLTEATRDSYRNEIRNDYMPQGNNQQPSAQPLHQQATSPTYSQQQNTPAPQQSDVPVQPIVQNSQPLNTLKIDINTCTEQQLANLPGIGVILAKKAVEMRAETGGFISVSDFCTKLNLMPHFSVQIENMTFASPVVPPKANSENTGRVIDI